MAAVVGWFIAEATMRNKKSAFYWLLLGVLVIVGLLYRLGAEEKPSPKRNFSTSQLLIPSLPGWGIYSGPEDRPPHDFYLREAVGGSVVRFMKPPDRIVQWSPANVDEGLWQPAADMTQWVVKFSTIGYAKSAYREHYWVPDYRNPFMPRKWELLDGLEYQSRVADQFRIVCESDRQQKAVSDCYLEAEYEEFYVLVHYSAFYPDDARNDLQGIAAAVDAQMEKFLGSQK